MCVAHLHLGVVHAPQLDLSVVSSGDDERHAWVKTGPVDAAVVSFQHVFDHAVGLAKQVGRTGILQMVVESTRARRHRLFAQA